MSKKTINVTVECFSPTLKNGLASVIHSALSGHIKENKNLIDELSEINIMVNAEERKKEEPSQSPIPLGSPVLVAFSEEKFNDSSRKGILIGYNHKDEFPFEVIVDHNIYPVCVQFCKLAEDKKAESEDIHWSHYEGQEIEVFDHCLEKWVKKTLYKYDTTMEWPFICFLDKGEGVVSWKTARLIEGKEPEIDWSKVPRGTKVFTADTKGYFNNESLEQEFFFGYFPNLEFPFWTFNSEQKQGATGYKFCKLAEPMNPEWEKK